MNFATNRYPSLPGVTTAYVDNIEERGPDARVTRYVYDAAGRKRFEIDALGALSEYRYDAAGQLTQTLQYERTLRFAGTPTEAQVVALLAGTTTQFTSGAEGFYGDAGTWENGQLKLTSQPLAGGNWAWAYSPRVLNAGASVKLDVTPTQLQQQLHTMVASVNDGGLYNRLAVQWERDGTLDAQTFDTKANVWRYVKIGNYAAGTTYTVEFLTDANGCTVYVYAKGTSRSSGISYTATDFCWTQLQLQFAAARDPGLPGVTTTYVDNIEERGPDARLTRYVYDAAGRKRFEIDALGAVNEYRYDAAGQLTQTLQYERTMAFAGVPTEAQVVAALGSATSTFDGDLQGWNGGAGIWEGGRLKLYSQPEAGGNWAGMNSPHVLNAGASFKFDVTPTQLQQTLHTMLESAGGNYNRLAVLWGADGTAYAQVAVKTGDWRQV
ncbi:MAG: hypothetical protein JF607_29505, partial [Burkholderiales bacterium]|nr:hypothetical protein [Burkholderiales bacterium]